MVVVTIQLHTHRFVGEDFCRRAGLTHKGVAFDAVCKQGCKELQLIVHVLVAHFALSHFLNQLLATSVGAPVVAEIIKVRHFVAAVHAYEHTTEIIQRVVGTKRPGRFALIVSHRFGNYTVQTFVDRVIHFMLLATNTRVDDQIFNAVVRQGTVERGSLRIAGRVDVVVPATSFI